MRFKTTSKDKGGYTLFYVKRGSNPTCPAIFKPCEQCYAGTSSCLKCLSEKDNIPGASINVYDSDGVTLLGKVRPTLQWANCERRCNFCYAKGAKPIYDVVAPDEKILFSIMIGRDSHQGCCCGCCCKSKTYYDDLE